MLLPPGDVERITRPLEPPLLRAGPDATFTLPPAPFRADPANMLTGPPCELTLLKRVIPAASALIPAVAFALLPVTIEIDPETPSADDAEPVPILSIPEVPVGALPVPMSSGPDLKLELAPTVLTLIVPWNVSKIILPP